jgi:hypothetical protein
MVAHGERFREHETAEWAPQFPYGNLKQIPLHQRIRERFCLSSLLNLAFLSISACIPRSLPLRNSRSNAKNRHSLRVTQAMQAGLTDRVWTFEEIAEMIDADPKPGPRGPYRKQ